MSNIKVINYIINNKNAFTHKLTFYQNLEYFYNNNEGTIIILPNLVIQYQYSANHFIDYLLTLNLSSFSSYKKALAKVLNYKYNNPVVINDILLISSNNHKFYETIYINISQVLFINELNKDETLITFKSFKTLKILKNILYLDRQIKKIKKVKRYLYENT